MNPEPGNKAVGTSIAELEERYRTFKAALRNDYRNIKQREYDETVGAKREIGYHAHLRKAEKGN